MGRIMLRHMAVMLLMLAAAWGLAACSSEVEEPRLPDSTAPEEAVWLKLRLWTAAPAGTRADGDQSDSAKGDPLGGEDGDGRESAYARENCIYDLNIFIYTREGGFGMNTPNPENIPVRKQVYEKAETDGGFPKKDDNSNSPITATFTDRLVKVEGYAPSEFDWVIVVANAGDSIKGVKTLGDLRDMILDSPSWTSGDGTPRNAGRFTMATARFSMKYGNIPDGKIILKDLDGSKARPFNVQTTLERTAARIDFWYEKNDVENGSEIVYDVTAGGNTLAKVRLSHIAPVNLMQKTSYAFKHVTSGDYTGSSFVCSDETTENGKPSNYVLEPTTLLKNSDNKPDTSELYGDTRAEYIRNTDNLSSVFSDKTSVESMLKGGESSDYNEPGLPFDRYTILRYANENTETGTDLTSDYTTGLVLRAVYVPLTVYSAYDSGSDLLIEDDTYEAGDTFWQFSPTAKEMGEKYNLYFSNAEAAEAYRAAHPEKNGKVREYAGGVCYYNLWLRHANIVADPHNPFEMEYAIVRNNIYRVGVSFTGPGTPTPEVREPDNIISRIFVRKWNFRLQGIIEI